VVLTASKRVIYNGPKQFKDNSLKVEEVWLQSIYAFLTSPMQISAWLIAIHHVEKLSKTRYPKQMTIWKCTKLSKLTKTLKNSRVPSLHLLPWVWTEHRQIILSSKILSMFQNCKSTNSTILWGVGYGP
jgi:hypothetical protein